MVSVRSIEVRVTTNAMVPPRRVPCAGMYVIVQRVAERAGVKRNTIGRLEQTTCRCGSMSS